MRVFGSHLGIVYELKERRPDEWAWSFQPPGRPQRKGIVRGEYRYAVIVAHRAIEVWRQMNRQSEAA